MNIICFRFLKFELKENDSVSTEMEATNTNLIENENEKEEDWAMENDITSSQEIIDRPIHTSTSITTAVNNGDNDQVSLKIMIFIDC